MLFVESCTVELVEVLQYITIIDQPAPTQSLSNFHLTSTAKGHKGFDDSSEDLCASDEQFLWTAVVIIMKNHFHTNHTPVQWAAG